MGFLDAFKAVGGGVGASLGVTMCPGLAVRKTASLPCAYARARPNHLIRSFRDGALAPDLRCAIAHRGISRFRARCCASPRN